MQRPSEPVAGESCLSILVRRKLPLPQFSLDSNCINALKNDEHVNQLERWEEDGVIELRLSEQAQREVERAGRKQRAKALNRWVPFDLITTEQERSTLTTIEQILARRGYLSANDRIDALIVFNAQKYHFILLTSDRNLLLNAEKLRFAVGAQIMTAEEAVRFISQEIWIRDKAALSLAERYRLLAPAWVGSD
jgi:hypothetical protein